MRGRESPTGTSALAAIAGDIGVEEVDAAEAVHLEVDEARDGNPAPARRGEPDGGDEPVAHLDVAPDEEPVDQGGFHTESHSTPCLIRHPVSSRQHRSGSAVGQYQFGETGLCLSQLVYTIGP